MRLFTLFYSLDSLLGVAMKTSVTSPMLRRATRSKASTKKKKEEKTTVARNKTRNHRLEGKEFCRVMTMMTALMKILRTMTTKPATKNNRQRVRARQRRKAENLLARKWKCLMIMSWNFKFMQFSHQVTTTVTLRATSTKK